MLSNGIAAHNAAGPPVSPLDKHVRTQAFDEPLRSRLVEDRDIIDAFKRRKEQRPIPLPDNRPRGTFEGPHRAVAIDRDNQAMPEVFRSFKEGDMTGVQQIVAAVCEDDLAAAGFRVADNLRKRCGRFDLMSGAQDWRL